MQQIKKGQRFVLKNKGRVAHTASSNSSHVAYPYCTLKRYPNVCDVRSARRSEPDCSMCKKKIDKKR